jgi:DNA polymerase-3 subunit delta
VLVFIDGELTASNALLQALRPKAQVREFKPLAQAEVAAWINQRASLLGVRLEARAVAALAGLVGNQLWTLDSELRKLATYAGDRAVSEEDVRSLVSLARDPNVFAMVDAIVEGRSRDAAEMMQRLFDEGEPAQRLLAMLARQYRLLLLTRELLDRRVRGPEISARLQVQGFVVQRLLKQAPAYNMERLRKAYRLLLDADLSVKRGIYDDVTALQLLLFELSVLARPTSATPPGGSRQGYSRPPAGRAPAPPRAATG